MLGGWLRFAKTTSLLILEIYCTQESDAQPGVSLDHFMPPLGPPPVRNTTFNGAFRPTDPTRTTVVIVASFGAFLIVPNVGVKAREDRYSLS
jgi:hypothetical protein